MKKKTPHPDGYPVRGGRPEAPANSTAPADVPHPRLTGNRCQCAACGQRFNSLSAFDAHRRGRHGPERRCLTAEDLTARGWLVNAAGFWITRTRGESRTQARTRGRFSAVLAGAGVSPRVTP